MGHHLLSKNGRINTQLRMETAKSVSYIDIYFIYKGAVLSNAVTELYSLIRNIYQRKDLSSQFPF